MYNRDCMIHHCTNFIRSGSPYEEVIKPVLESYFGEGCADAPKALHPHQRGRRFKSGQVGFHRQAVARLRHAVQLDVPHDPVHQSKKRGYKGDLDLDAKYMTAVTGDEYTRAGFGL